MNPLLWNIWPNPCAQGTGAPGAKHCHAEQCFVAVSWLAQQVLYLPCSAAAGTQPQNSERPAVVALGSRHS
jgi:hypothetical protein